MQARRGVLGGIIGAAALLSSPRDASAAFGDAARVSEIDGIAIQSGESEHCMLYREGLREGRAPKIWQASECCVYVQVFGSKATNTSG